MNSTVLEHINELFDSYDLFGGKGEKIRRSITAKFPDLTEEEIIEIQSYLRAFYESCTEYAVKLAYKFRTPFLPKDEAALQEISEYVQKCRKLYPEIDEKHILDLLSTVCWLQNR